MRRPFAIAVVCLLVMGSPSLHGDESSTPGTQRGIELPRVGTLGQLAKARPVARVEAFADGTIRLDGGDPLSLVELRDELQRTTAGAGNRNADGSARHLLLVVADKDVPWAIPQWVLQAAADPRVRIPEIYFAARPREGEETGAIVCPLPRDRGLARTGSTGARLIVKLLAPRASEPSDPAALFAEIAAQARAAGGVGHVHFEIRTPPPFGPSVRTGTILEVLDVLARAGARTVTFEGHATPAGNGAGSVAWLREQVAAYKLQGAGARIRLGAARIGEQTADAQEPEAQGLLPRVYGFGDPSAAITGLEEQLLEDEFPAPSTTAGTGRSEGAWDDTAGEGATRSFGARERDDGASPREARNRAIEDALRWLAAHQADHGGWEAATFGRWCDGKRVATSTTGAGKAEFDVGVTGLALLAFSGAGYAYGGDHAYASVLKKGLRHLVEAQDEGGCFGTRRSQQYVYNHAIATLALIEAYGMTRRRVFVGPVQRGLDFIAHARNPYFAWRYGIKPGDNDTSVTAWMIAALDAARLMNEDARAEGAPPVFRIDTDAFDGARAWIDKMTEPDYGRTGYILRGGSPARPAGLVDRFPGDKSEAMSGAAICVRVALGESPKRSPAIRKAMQLVLSTKPTWNPADGSIDMIGWYFGSLAAFQVSGTTWSTWKRALERAVIRNQRRDGGPCGLRGSWDPVGPWGSYGGRVYATALMALALETPERYPRRP